MRDRRLFKQYTRVLLKMLMRPKLSCSVIVWQISQVMTVLACSGQTCVLVFSYCDPFFCILNGHMCALCRRNKVMPLVSARRQKGHLLE